MSWAFDVWDPTQAEEDARREKAEEKAEGKAVAEVLSKAMPTKAVPTVGQPVLFKIPELSLRKTLEGARALWPDIWAGITQARGYVEKGWKPAQQLAESFGREVTERTEPVGGRYVATPGAVEHLERALPGLLGLEQSPRQRLLESSVLPGMSTAEQLAYHRRAEADRRAAIGNTAAYLQRRGYPPHVAFALAGEMQGMLQPQLNVGVPMEALTPGQQARRLEAVKTAVPAAELAIRGSLGREAAQLGQDTLRYQDILMRRQTAPELMQAATQLGAAATLTPLQAQRMGVETMVGPSLNVLGTMAGAHRTQTAGITSLADTKSKLAAAQEQAKLAANMPILQAIAEKAKGMKAAQFKDMLRMFVAYVEKNPDAIKKMLETPD